MSRTDLCQSIALLEHSDGLFLVQGAAGAIGARLGLDLDKAAARLDTARSDLEQSALSEAVLRYRLWVRMAEALALPVLPPFSTKSATRAATGFAVRAAERLSPGINARERARSRKGPTDKAGLDWVASQAEKAWGRAKEAFEKDRTHSFPEIVSAELLDLMADPEAVAMAAQDADPQMAEALRKGQARAQAALAVGGGWMAFAAVVGNAGFAPYILAAKLSAFIPLVGGPALVSLLATLVNPATVLVGVASLGWIGLGRGASAVRSQLAARLGVILAVQGSAERDQGGARFLTDMRSLDRETGTALQWLGAADRKMLRRMLARLDGQLGLAVPPVAGVPPKPFDARRVLDDVVDAGLVAGATAGEMLWHAAALDPDVVLAGDFSRSADLGDPLRFAAEAGAFLTEGAGYSLRGYAAERLVMDALLAEGHSVQLAEMSNTPGMDLLVDGMPVQVKCSGQLSTLAEHFETYPDIPVIANSDLVLKAQESGAPWVDMVTTVPGFEIADLEARIAETLGHAIDLAEPDILEFAVSAGILRGGLEVARGQIPVSDLPAWLLMDGASRGVLAFAGSKAGAWIGLVAIGPAGALILGPAIGAAALMGNGKVKATMQRHLMKAWTTRVSEACVTLHHALMAAAGRRVTLLQERSEQLSAQGSRSDVHGWMGRRAMDDVVAALEDLQELEASGKKTEADAIQLLFLARDIAPADASVLRASRRLEAALAERPGVQAALADTATPVMGVLWQRAAGLTGRRRPES